jgi:hypothetical protein
MYTVVIAFTDADKVVTNKTYQQQTSQNVSDILKKIMSDKTIVLRGIQIAPAPVVVPPAKS